jgi:hypothetical protein
MPEGLVNSTETFRRVMQEILAEYLDEFCFVYNGKLIVFSASESTLQKVLRSTLIYRKFLGTLGLPFCRATGHLVS